VISISSIIYLELFYDVHFMVRPSVKALLYFQQQPFPVIDKVMFVVISKSLSVAKQPDKQQPSTAYNFKRKPEFGSGKLLLIQLRWHGTDQENVVRWHRYTPSDF